MKKNGFLYTLILFLVVVFVCRPLPAFAEEGRHIDYSRLGSIFLELEQNGEKIPGATFDIYFVARAVKGAFGVEFELTPEFSYFNKLDMLFDSQYGGYSEELAEAITDYITTSGIEPEFTRTTNASGEFSLLALELGVYAVVPKNNIPNIATTSPFIIPVPSEVNGNFIYDVNAGPKTVIATAIDITVMKVWNDGDRSHAGESITIELLEGDKVVETRRLSDANGWKYTFHNKRNHDRWSVREVDVPENYVVTYKRDDNTLIITNSTDIVPPPVTDDATGTDTQEPQPKPPVNTTAPTTQKPKPSNPGYLIRTGQLRWPIPVLAIAGVLLVIIGVALVFRRKKHG